MIAGITSNQNEFLELFDKIFLLHCSPGTFIARLDTRENNEFAKEKSEQEHLLSWYKEFEEEMLKKGAVPINTERSITDIADEITDIIDS